MSLYAFHLGQIISTVLGQIDHGGQDGNAARTRIIEQDGGGLATTTLIFKFQQWTHKTLKTTK